VASACHTPFTAWNQAALPFESFQSSANDSVTSGRYSASPGLAQYGLLKIGSSWNCVTRESPFTITTSS
jgi:hypothetical protein